MAVGYPKMKSPKLSEMRKKLKAMEREANRKMLAGRHNWGDQHRRESIKALRREIAILRQNAWGHPTGATE